MKGFFNLGIWFWLSLPLLGFGWWFGSGWMSDQQLRRPADPVEPISVKRFR